MQQLIAGEVVSLKALAAAEGLDPAEISRLLPLACLSPDIVEAVLAGRQPVNVTVERLKRLHDLPLEWSTQQPASWLSIECERNVNRPEPLPVKAAESYRVSGVRVPPPLLTKSINYLSKANRPVNSGNRTRPLPLGP
jgi:hypothetical protein